MFLVHASSYPLGVKSPGTPFSVNSSSCLPNEGTVCFERSWGDFLYS